MYKKTGPWLAFDTTDRRSGGNKKNQENFIISSTQLLLSQLIKINDFTLNHQNRKNFTSIIEKRLRPVNVWTKVKRNKKINRTLTLRNSQILLGTKCAQIPYNH